MFREGKDQASLYGQATEATPGAEIKFKTRQNGQDEFII